MSYLVSIVIPTHNREKYARKTIESILGIDGDIQIVVHDTSHNDQLDDYARLIKDSRLKYVRCREALSMTENHNRAFQYAEGEYVTYIGDDDTVSTGIVEICSWAKENNVQAVSQDIKVNYVWPDFLSKLKGTAHSSRVYFAKNISAKIRKVELIKASKVAFRGAIQGADNLPKIYHGLVRRKELQRCYDDFGGIFHGISPDVSGAICVLSSISEYYETDYPFTVPGASGGSNTGRAAMNNHKGQIGEDSHTKRYKDLRWPEYLPKLATPEMVWAHGVVEALEKVNPSKLKEYNWYRLYSICLIRNRSSAVHVLECMNKNKYIAPVNKTTLLINVLNFLFERLKFWIARLSNPSAAGRRDYVGGVESTEKVPKVISKYFADKKLKIRYP